MRTSFKPFIAGIVLTSITWAIAFYYYLSLIPNGSIKGIPTMRQSFAEAHPDVIKQISASGVIITEMSNDLDVEEDESLVHKHHEKIETRSKTLKKKKSMLVESFDDSLGLVRNEQDKKIREQGYTHHAFNVLVSSRLDYHRAIPDSRHKM